MAFLLVDHTNDRTYATVLRVYLSVVCDSIVAKRCVLEQKLLLTAYRNLGSRIWEIDLYQIEWPWPMFRGHLRSCQPLCHIRHWISRKPLEIEAWFRRTTIRKWPTRNQMVTWLMTSRDPKGQTHDPNTLRAQYLKQLEMPFSNNCYIVCCEAVLSAILATSGLLLWFVSGLNI